ncbi:glycerol kinase [Bryobacterales bacterium F-183]|nr:glycerol kinase [Bryobacterales bacterium F-183]
MQAILAIDQGTTNTKALLFDRTGAVVSRASQPVGVTYPQPGWVEQDADVIWRSVTAAIDACLLANPGVEVTALGLANQRETAVVWDRATGRPIAPAVIWQCRRTAAVCDRLQESGQEPEIRRRSGLAVDPLFSATKIRWILEHVPDALARAKNGELCAGNIDSWLLWKLTGGQVHATDFSNASRTQILNISTAQWDRELLEVFGVPVACLPTLRDSSGIYGVTEGTGTLPPGIPIAGVAGDSHAALFGHAAFAPGLVKATYGTGSSLMSRVSGPLESANGLSTTVAWSIDHQVQHALEGNITNTGGAVEWFSGFLGLPGGAQEAAALAASVDDSAGVYMVPAFAGLGAPHWDAHARGLFSGLTRGTTAAHAARATLDAIAYQVADVFRAFRQDSGIDCAAMLADGGASGNDQLMQFQADIIDCPVIRNESGDVAACGAAWLAGLATGFWQSLEELETLPRSVRRFEPTMPAGRRAALLSGWADALHRCRTASR